MLLRKGYVGSLAALSLLLVASVCAAEGPAEYCKSAAKLYGEGDLKGALEEARWCLEALEQAAQKARSEKFAANIDGWKRGEVKQEKVMGVATTEATYTKGGKSIKVSLTSGSGQGLGALAMLGQLGVQHAGTKERIQRRTAAVTEAGNKVEVRVSLKQGEGGILVFSSVDAGREGTVGFAKKFPINDVDQ